MTVVHKMEKCYYCGHYVILTLSGYEHFDETSQSVTRECKERNCACSTPRSGGRAGCV